jgi:hypothetical protein
VIHEGTKHFVEEQPARGSSGDESIVRAVKRDQPEVIRLVAQ